MALFIGTLCGNFHNGETWNSFLEIGNRNQAATDWARNFSKKYTGSGRG